MTSRLERKQRRANSVPALLEEARRLRALNPVPRDVPIYATRNWPRTLTGEQYQAELNRLVHEAEGKGITVVVHRPPTAPPGLPGWLDDTYYEGLCAGIRVFLAHSLTEFEHALTWFPQPPMEENEK